jgi:predicted nucleic acid-binding protein
LRIVDSVGWIAYLTDAPLADEYEKYVASPDDLVTPAVVLYEVYKHAVLSSGEHGGRLALAAMVKTQVIPLSGGLAVSAAQVSVRHKLPLADSVIYATALATGATIVTSDAHFEGLPQVEFIPRHPTGESS